MKAIMSDKLFNILNDKKGARDLSTAITILRNTDSEAVNVTILGKHYTLSLAKRDK